MASGSVTETELMPSLLAVISEPNTDKSKNRNGFPKPKPELLQNSEPIDIRLKLRIRDAQVQSGGF